MVDKKLDFGVGDMVISDCNTEIECLVKILSLNNNNLFVLVRKKKSKIKYKNRSKKKKCEYLVKEIQKRMDV